jgi:hypothetical protein
VLECQQGCVHSQPHTGTDREWGSNVSVTAPRTFVQWPSVGKCTDRSPCHRHCWQNHQCHIHSLDKAHVTVTVVTLCSTLNDLGTPPVPCYPKTRKSAFQYWPNAKWNFFHFWFVTNIEIAVFWDLTLCSVAEWRWHFKWTCCLRHDIREVSCISDSRDIGTGLWVGQGQMVARQQNCKQTNRRCYGLLQPCFPITYPYTTSSLSISSFACIYTVIFPSKFLLYSQEEGSSFFQTLETRLHSNISQRENSPTRPRQKRFRSMNFVAFVKLSHMNQHKM